MSVVIITISKMRKLRWERSSNLIKFAQRVSGEVGPELRPPDHVRPLRAVLHFHSQLGKRQPFVLLSFWRHPYTTYTTSIPLMM